MANRPKSKNANRSSLNNENITIDAKHSEMMKYFNTLQTSTDTLKNELKKLVAEYNNKDNSKKNDIEYILHRDNLRDKINEIKSKINSINNNEEINKYYLDVGILLHNYYENIELSKNINNSENFEENLINYDESDIENYSDEDIEDDVYEINKKDEDPKKNYKSVLNFFNNRESNDIIESKNDSDKNKVSEDIEINKNDGNYASLKISDFVKEELTFKKKNILEEYLQKIDSNYITKIKVDINICKCSNCNLEMTVYPSDGIQICENCGIQQNILIESDKPSFKDPPMEVCYFSYKRINHFNEWLAQFQAKESTEIPDEVYEKILIEIKKERIVKLEKLDTKKIRQYLKKIKLNKYYDHAAHILYQINGIQPPSMSKELEEKLRLMFKEIQGPFMKVCPKKRKNFLNYSYVLHKFVELLGLDEYKIYFPLLKDREKLHQTDMIWKKICELLGWDFIKSI
jgi:hypothetical protein